MELVLQCFNSLHLDECSTTEDTLRVKAVIDDNSNIVAYLFYTFKIRKRNMAEMSDWCGKLNNCVLFDVLRKNASTSKGTSEAKSILAVYDGLLYVWDAYGAALLATNLKSLKSQSCFHRSTYQVKVIKCHFTQLSTPYLFSLISFMTPIEAIVPS